MKAERKAKLHELESFPAIVSNLQELSRRKELKNDIDQIKACKCSVDKACPCQHQGVC